MMYVEKERARAPLVTRRRLTDLFRVLWRAQSYRNIAYLLLAFPLGLTYFVVLVTGISTGIGTAIIGVGLFLLLLMLGFAWSMAVLERHLVMALLRVDVPPLSGPPAVYRSRWQHLKAHLARPVTWKSLAYLFLEFPFGVISFTLTVALLSVSLGLALIPLVYWIEWTVAQHTGDMAGSYPYVAIQAIWQHVPQPFALILVVALFLLNSAVGLCLTAVKLYALNGLAYGWGQFARLMLGMSPGEQQLVEARARATREQARAESADQRRRELIVNVSHELRTPIANIRGHVDSLRMPLGERLVESDRQAYLGIVGREVERLSALVDDLLSLARADADELRLQLQPTAVGPIVEEVFQALAPLAQRDRRVTLVRNIAPDLPRVLADRDRLTQVLLNLARNAITATPAGGLVFLDLEQADGDHVALVVSDTGHGIAPEDLERVFDRFYRADTARGRATGGFGLGLSIVRDLVQAMGGTVTATSTVGAGSSFRVVLRAAPAGGYPQLPL